MALASWGRSPPRAASRRISATWARRPSACSTYARSSFRYKERNADGNGPLEYGLIAEEVVEVFPELVVYDNEGRPETVKYHLLSSMLLNELQKEHERNNEEGEDLPRLGGPQSRRSSPGLRKTDRDDGPGPHRAFHVRRNTCPPTVLALYAALTGRLASGDNPQIRSRSSSARRKGASDGKLVQSLRTYCGYSRIVGCSNGQRSTSGRNREDSTGSARSMGQRDPAIR